MQIIEHILSWIAPHYCLLCNSEGALLCGDCTKRLQPVVPHCYRCGRLNNAQKSCESCRKYGLYSVNSSVLYDEIAGALVKKLKFGRARAAAQEMAQIIAINLADLPQNAIIVHVPTANARVRTRGYDQAQLLAVELSKLVHRPSAVLLARTNNIRQVGANGTLRRTQMRQAFRPLKGYIIQNAHIVLVDDVITTGATLEAAAQVLRANGARRVSAVVFAQA